MAKPRAKRGETLVETLAAILIVTLTSLFFLTSVIAAVKINRAASVADDSLRVAQEAVETKKNAQDSTITVTVGSKTREYDVTTYGDSSDLQGYVLN